ncbi:MAG: ATP-binding cassette domain-containing protein [Campylobacteraceae bacterium]|jgi:D-methionine transport system ATP-binding protein|nr:ATP-binding cassette domain-containing protein [Campylobacteraceae bacterium]
MAFFRADTADFEILADNAVSENRANRGEVKLEAVGKIYESSAGKVKALDNVSVDIKSGEIFGIIGRSGAGKSSLIRMINRLEKPTSGRVLVNGEDIALLNEKELVALRRRIGMIFQHFNLLSAKSVFENIALPLKVAGANRAHIKSRVNDMLELVGLSEKYKTYPSRLSGGQKQRVGIARALATQPEILLCDEATSALDPETTRSILQLLRDINKKLGITIILITHEMSVIREIADRTLVLEKGEIAELGEVWRVFGAPHHEATRALLAPLRQSLPEDLAAILVKEKPEHADYNQIVALKYTGEGALECDLARIANSLHASVQLVHGGVDRIQGRAFGRLLVSISSEARLPDLKPLMQGDDAIVHNIEVIGYVPLPDYSI